MLFNRMTSHFNFPHPDLDSYDWPALREIVERIETYGADLSETARKVKELEGSRREAERKDVAEHAAAIQSGKRDPGTPHQDRLEAELKDATRRRDALRVALQGLGPELLKVIEQGRGEWLGEVQDGLSEATQRLEEAREAMRRAEGDVAQHKELQAWLEDPSDYRPGRASRERKEAPKAKPPTFSVIGGRQAAVSSENTHALRITRGSGPLGAA